MSPLFRLPEAVRRDQATEAWLRARPGPLGEIARRWFDRLRHCGDDVTECLHDGHATACVHDAAFAYVNVFTAHVNVGFFRGADLPDPEGLLAGSGRFMRHVKLRSGQDVDARAVEQLVDAAYADMRTRVSSR